jgi:hypothetical protein
MRGLTAKSRTRLIGTRIRSLDIVCVAEDLDRIGRGLFPRAYFEYPVSIYVNKYCK